MFLTCTGCYSVHELYARIYAITCNPTTSITTCRFPPRMDENYSILPHGVNFQDPIFPDTAESHHMFSSLFQFSNCTAGTQVHTYSPEWEAQEDSRVRSTMVV